MVGVEFENGLGLSRFGIFDVLGFVQHYPMPSDLP